MPTRKKCAFLTKHHDGSRLDRRIHPNAEILGTVGVGEANVARDFDITLEETSHSPALTINARSIATANANDTRPVPLVFTPHARATRCATAFTLNPHPCLSFPYATWPNFSPHPTRPASRAFTAPVDTHPPFAFSNDTGAARGIHTEYAKSTNSAVAYAFNTMPS